jgi:hypothetical protein
MKPFIYDCTNGLSTRIGGRGAVCTALGCVASQQLARFQRAACRRTLVPSLQAKRERVVFTRPTVCSLSAAVPRACHIKRLRFAGGLP